MSSPIQPSSQALKESKHDHHGDPTPPTPSAPGGYDPDPIDNAVVPINGGCGCSLLRVVAVITTLAAVTFMLFTFFYSSGYFHFDVFIGPIGSTVFPVAASALTLLSGVLTCLTFTHS